jgi:hypothetical protein
VQHSEMNACDELVACILGHGQCPPAPVTLLMTFSWALVGLMQMTTSPAVGHQGSVTEPVTM